MSTIHTVTIILEGLCRIFFRIYMKYCCLHVHLHSKQTLIMRLFQPIVTFNYSCIMLINFRIILIKIAIYYSQNCAGIRLRPNECIALWGKPNMMINLQ